MRSQTVAFLRRLSVLIVVVVGLLLLSTTVEDSDPAGGADGTNIFIGFITWAVVIFAGAEAIRWLRRETRRVRRRHERRRR